MKIVVVLIFLLLIQCLYFTSGLYSSPVLHARGRREVGLTKWGSSLLRGRAVLAPRSAAKPDSSPTPTTQPTVNSLNDIEEWLGDLNNEGFWKGVVCAICKLLHILSSSTQPLISMYIMYCFLC